MRLVVVRVSTADEVHGSHIPETAEAMCESVRAVTALRCATSRGVGFREVWFGELRKRGFVVAGDALRVDVDPTMVGRVIGFGACCLTGRT